MGTRGSVMFSTDPSPTAHRIRVIAIAVLGLTTTFALLFLSLNPAVEAGARPTPDDVAAARDVWQQLTDRTDEDEPRRVRVDNAAIRGVSALASDATGSARFDGGIEGGVLSGTMSLALPAGLWINASVTATGEHVRFPDYSLKIGRVRFPEFAGRWAAEFGRWVLRWKGVDIPPLDTMVRRMDVGPNAVLAELAIPHDRGAMRGLIAASGASVDEALLRDIYCRIASDRSKSSAPDLSALVRNTFDRSHATASAEYSRAAFVALSLLVVGDTAESLSPQAAAVRKDCPRPSEPVLLQGRADLAMHWTLSAGLTAVLGQEAASSLGEWKELNDSLADGSGFSFVDLAADRAGMKAALRALDDSTLSGEMSKLSRATEDELLPRALLETPEGLTDAAFIDRFGALDNARYLRAVASIDRVLAQKDR